MKIKTVITSETAHRNHHSKSISAASFEALGATNGMSAKKR
jgi:hypothetical protein